MNEVEEMAKRIEEQKRHKEVIKALDWGVKYITSLLRPYPMDIQRHLEDNPATIFMAVYWKKPEEPKEEEEKIVVAGKTISYDEETGEYIITEPKESEDKT